MSTAVWKSKLTPKQLENKRLGDREKQRKKRLERKNSVAHLRNQLDLLLSRNESNTVRAVVQENAALRAEVAELKAALRQIAVLTADPEHNADSQTATPQTGSDVSVTELSGVDRPLAYLQRSRSVLSRCSIPRQVAEVASSRDSFGQLVSSIDGLVDGFLSWKLLQGHKIGLKFLINAPDDEICLADGPTFYTELRRKLCNLEPITRNVQHSSSSCIDKNNRPSTDMELQDRRIALYALRLVEPWLPKLRSGADRVVHFWISYSLCKFWAFPTRRNFDQIPPWMLPMPAQFWNDHPGYLDFIPWPSLRTYLSHSWQQYEMNDLYMLLTESHHFAIGTTVTEDWPLYYDDSSQSLALDVDFKMAMLDLSNFNFHGKFLTTYPELLLLIQSDCTVSGNMLS